MSDIAKHMFAVDCKSAKRNRRRAAEASLHEKKLLRALSKAPNAGRARHYARRYLNAFDARLMAVHDAYVALKPRQRPRQKDLAQIAEGLDAWKGTDEQVLLNLKEKSDNSGNFRLLLDFGIQNRALQHLVRRALLAQAELCPNQFAVRGGIAAAIELVIGELKRGHRWAVESDIEDFFPSFGGELIPGLLPVPKEVTRRVILSESLNITPGRSTRALLGLDDGWLSDEEVEILLGETLSEARRGIPQGSAASSLVAEIALASVFAELPSCGSALGYADNFLVMAADEDRACAMAIALWSALAAHPAGPFRPRPIFYRAGEELTFLGHTLREASGSVRVSPSPKNQIKFWNNLNVGLQRVASSSLSIGRRMARLDELRNYVCSWVSSFRLCDDIELYRTQGLARVEELKSRLSK